MITIAGKLINPDQVKTAEVDTRHYMNGSESCLVIVFNDGTIFRQRHGYGFDAWAALKKLEAEL